MKADTLKGDTQFTFWYLFVIIYITYLHDSSADSLFKGKKLSERPTLV